MKYFLAFPLLFSVLTFSLTAQTNSRAQVYVDAFTSFGFLDFEPFKLGFGGGVQLSLEKPLTVKSAIGFHFGASKMGAYNRVYGTSSYDILPNGFQHVDINTKIQAFGFLDAGLHFRHRPKLKSPWSWSLGIHASLLTNPVGRRYNRNSLNTRLPQIEENSYTPSTIIGASTSSGSLDPKDFASYDISAEAALYYEISKGCALRASFRQGTQNLIKPIVAPAGNAQHYLSMLSVGFNARLR